MRRLRTLQQSRSAVWRVFADNLALVVGQEAVQGRLFRETRYGDGGLIGARPVRMKTEGIAGGVSQEEPEHRRISIARAEKSSRHPITGSGQTIKDGQARTIRPPRVEPFHMRW